MIIEIKVVEHEAFYGKRAFITLSDGNDRIQSIVDSGVFKMILHVSEGFDINKQHNDITQRNFDRDIANGVYNVLESRSNKK